MNLKKSGIIDMILPIGFLYIAWQAVSSFINPSTAKTSTVTTGECPKGKSYTKPVFGECDPNYSLKIFGNFPFDTCDCMSDIGIAPAPAPAPAPAHDIPFQENLPSLAMCNQVWATQGTWDTKCILAGYTAPTPPPLPENVSPFTGKPWECGVSPYLPGCL